MLFKIAAAATLASTLVLGAPAPTSSKRAPNATQTFYYNTTGEGVWFNCNGNGKASFSYDDGPYYGSKAADFFTSHGVNATFFLNGYNWGCIYDHADDLRDRYNKGHLIGSHTWNHGDVSQMTIEQLKQELDLNEIALKRILGIKPAYFRFPYGSYKQEHADYVNSRGYHIVQWSVDSGDSEGAPYEQQMKNLRGEIAQYPKSIMPLSHETYATSMDDVVPNIVPDAMKAGYNIVTMDECLAGPGQTLPRYQEIGEPEEYDPNTWVCNTLPPGAD